MRRGKNDPGETIKKFGIAASLGTVFVSYVAAGLLIGYFLDRWLGTSPWLFLLFFAIGVGGAIYNVFKLAARL
jgi:ATP synthase protein I